MSILIWHSYGAGLIYKTYPEYGLNAKELMPIQLYSTLLKIVCIPRDLFSSIPEKTVSILIMARYMIPTRKES